MATYELRPYDEINREERSACAHLFRLLHEGLAETPEQSGLAKVLALLNLDTSAEQLRDARIYTEVALLRDVAWDLDEVDEQEVLRLLDHDKESAGPLDARQARALYKSALSTKPDLAIAIGDQLIVFEAKLTQAFSKDQLKLTGKLTDIWVKHFSACFGLGGEPKSRVLKLGDKKHNPDLSWQDIAKVAAALYPANDRTRLSLQCTVELLDKLSERAERQACELAALFGEKATNEFRAYLEAIGAPELDKVVVPLEEATYEPLLKCIRSLLSSDKVAANGNAKSRSDFALRAEYEAGPHGAFFQEVFRLVDGNGSAWLKGKQDVGVRVVRSSHPKDVSVCTLSQLREEVRFLLSRPAGVA